MDKTQETMATINNTSRQLKSKLNGPNEIFADDLTNHYSFSNIHHPNPSSINMRESAMEESWVLSKLSPALQKALLPYLNETVISEAKYVPSLKKFVTGKLFETSASYVPIFLNNPVSNAPFSSTIETNSPMVTKHSGPSSSLISKPRVYYVPKVAVYQFIKQCERELDNISIFEGQLVKCINSLKVLSTNNTNTSKNLLPVSIGDKLSLESEYCVELLKKRFLDFEGIGSVFHSILIVIDANFISNLKSTGNEERSRVFTACAIKRFLYADVINCNVGFNVIYPGKNGGVNSPLGSPYVIHSSSTDNLAIAEKFIDDAIFNNHVGVVDMPISAILNEIQLLPNKSDYDFCLLASVCNHFIIDKTAVKKTLPSLSVPFPIGVFLTSPAPKVEAFSKKIAESTCHNSSSFVRIKYFNNSSNVAFYNWRSTFIANSVDQIIRGIDEDFSTNMLNIQDQLTIATILLDDLSLSIDYWESEKAMAMKLFESNKMSGAISLENSISTVRVGGGYLFGSIDEKQHPDQLFCSVFEKSLVVGGDGDQQATADGVKYSGTMLGEGSLDRGAVDTILPPRA